MADHPIHPFHIAIPVDDIPAARQFYGELLGCPEGRSADTWVDFNLYGHQVVVHYQPRTTHSSESLHHNYVDGHDIPVPHFGVVLTMEDWEILCQRLKQANVQFKIAPYIRFKGQAGEQATMFLLDPFGNALEFKAFKNLSYLFKK